MESKTEQNAGPTNCNTENDSHETSTELHKTDLDPCVAKSSRDQLEIETKTSHSQEMSSRRMLKNTGVICAVFFFNFLAYDGMASLQSSIHVQGGMGVITQDVVYISVAVSSLLLPKIVISLLGHQLSMSAGVMTYILWMAANGYAVWATMVPASVVVGVGSAILWTAQGSYFTIVAGRYATSTGQDVGTVMPRFFGVLFAFNKLSVVVGSVISSMVLKQTPANLTTPDEAELERTCGLHDCPGGGAGNNSNINLDKPSAGVLWTLVGVYVSMGVLSFVISCLFVDKLPAAWLSDDRGRSVGTHTVALSSLFATFRQMANRRQLLLIPLSMYSGLEQAFQDAEYTKSFVTCFLGVWMVGLSSIPHMLSNAATSLAGGRLVGTTGILPLCILGIIVTLAYELTLLFWTPSPHQWAMFLITPCFNGIADAIWALLLNAAHGLFFPTNSEAAFATYKFWQSIGRIQGYGFSSFLCTAIKLYIFIAFSAFGIITFLVVYFAFLRTVDETRYATETISETKAENDEIDGLVDGNMMRTDV